MYTFVNRSVHGAIDYVVANVKIITRKGDESTDNTFTGSITWQDFPDLLGALNFDLTIGSVQTRANMADNWKSGVCCTILCYHFQENWYFIICPLHKRAYFWTFVGPLSFPRFSWDSWYCSVGTSRTFDCCFPPYQALVMECCGQGQRSR